MKTINLLIICVTGLVGLWVWTATHKLESTSISAPAPSVDVGAIKTLIKKDAELGDACQMAIKEINPQSDGDIDQIAALANNYTEQARAIPISDCPADFGEAYYRHLGAWKSFAEATSAHPHIEGAGENFLKNFFRGATGAFQGTSRAQQDWKDWLVKVKQSQSEIETTWNEIE